MWDRLFLESSKNWLPCFCKSYQLQSATKTQNTHLSLNFRWYTHIFFKNYLSRLAHKAVGFIISFTCLYIIIHCSFFNFIITVVCVSVFVRVWCVWVWVHLYDSMHTESQGTALGTSFSFQHGSAGQALLQASTPRVIAPHQRHYIFLPICLPTADLSHSPCPDREHVHTSYLIILSLHMLVLEYRIVIIRDHCRLPCLFSLMISYH